MNFQKLLDEELELVKEKGIKPKLLIHACCGPCSSYVIEYLNKYFDITMYYYNPNIYPTYEFLRRYDELEKFIKDFNLKNDIEVKLEAVDYETKEFYESIRGLEHDGEKSKRCYNCYELRMAKAAKYAKENTYDYFTTTLSISPYKNAEWINEIGKKLEDKIGIKYLYSDFKKKNGYKRSLELSKEYNLYRQEYCGCVYSKEERERK